MAFQFANNLWSFFTGKKATTESSGGSAALIPRKIHQLWIPPAHLQDVPDDVITQVRHWKETHPDFEHRLWTVDEVAAVLPAARAARMMSAVRLSRFEAMQADIVRLYILWEFGGFWSDLKVKPRRRWLDEHLNDQLVLVEHFRSEFIPDPNGVLINNLIGCNPRNEFIEACINQTHTNIDQRLSTTIWNIAGPNMYMGVYADWVKRTGRPPNGVILPSDYVWGEIAEMGHGSYSSNHRHWSYREKFESIYLDAANLDCR